MKTTIIFLLLGFSFISYSQNVVHWNYSAKKISDKTYELHLTATIDDGWHIYAQVQPKDAVSLPTKISFAKNPLLTITGKPKEIGKKEKQKLDVLDVTQYYYAGKVDFVQTVTLKAKVKTNVTGSIEYMACTEERCLPPATEKFSITIGD